MRARNMALGIVVLAGLLGDRARAEDRTPDVVGLGFERAIAMLEAGRFQIGVEFDANAPTGVVFRQEPGGFAPRPPESFVVIHVGGDPAQTFEAPPAAASPPAGVAPAFPSAPDRRPPSSAPPAVVDDTPPAGPAPVIAPPPAAPAAAPSAPSDPIRPAPVRPAATARPAPADAADATPLAGLPAATPRNSTGPALPNVLSMPEAQARQRLAGWRIRVEQTVSLPEYVGRVVNQFPFPGQPLAPGESVTIVVAIPNTPSDQQLSVPSLRGLTISEAMANLTRAGFGADVRTLPSDDANAHRVLEQRPLSGSLAPAGSNVQVLVGRGSAAPGAPAPGPGPSSAPAVPSVPRVEPEVPRLPSRPPSSANVPEGAPPGSGLLGTPTLISPAEGQSFPRAYGSTFQWTPVPGAEWYEWEMQGESASGEWQALATETVPTTRHRPDRMERGRFRWRVRAMRGDAEGEWSVYFRLYMY